jgi:hypothetical protein
MAVLAVLGMTGGIIYAGATPVQKCVIAKQKAAAKKATAKLKCWEQAIALGANVDQTCLTTADTKFKAAIEKAEATGSCAITGQTDAIESEVDTCVNNIVAVTNHTCTTAGAACGSCGTGKCWYHCVGGVTAELVCLATTQVDFVCGDDSSCAAGQVCGTPVGGGCNTLAASCEVPCP